GTSTDTRRFEIHLAAHRMMTITAITSKRASDHGSTAPLARAVPATTPARPTDTPLSQIDANLVAFAAFRVCGAAAWWINATPESDRRKFSEVASGILLSVDCEYSEIIKPDRASHRLVVAESWSPHNGHGHRHRFLRGRRSRQIPLGVDERRRRGKPARS